MAKKKTAPATIEEKMEAALVPVEEQPYPVPGNWCWVSIGSVLTLQAGKNINAKQISNESTGLFQFPCYGGNGIRGYVDSYNRNGQFPIIGRQGALCGNLNWAEGKFYATEHAVVVDCPDFVHKRWAYYVLAYMNLNQYATATAQPGLAVSKIVELPLSLPPLPEQRRIVDRIESLFAKLDVAKEKAQAVIDGYEERKAAILHRAFTGELTANVRAERGVGLDIWKKTTLGDIVTGFKYGTSEKSDYSNAGTPVFRIPNIGDGIIDFTDMKCLAGEADESYLVYENDVLIIRSNGSRDLVGKCAIIPKLECRYAYASFLIKIVPSDLIRPDYLVRFLNSSEARTQMFTKAKSSSGIHNINSKELGSITINLPKPWEQIIIVTLIDTLLAKEAAVKEAAETTLTTIDTMKQAILSRAFRGELGTNDPNDEPAEELLKRILASA